MKSFRYILIISLTLIGYVTIAEEIANIPNYEPKRIHQKDSLEFIFSFPCTAFHNEYGVIENNSDEIYVTQWTWDSIAKYDKNGGLLDLFSIPGVSGIRDLAYDGDISYGSVNDTVLYVMDFETKQLVTTVDMPFIIQAIAFNNHDEVFWVCGEGLSTLYQTDATGAHLGYINIQEYDSINITGLAHYWWWGEDDVLWMLFQHNDKTLLMKYDIYEQHQVGYAIDMSYLAEGNQSGGLYIKQNGRDYYIGGIIQDELVFALNDDYVNLLVSDPEIKLPKFNIYPNPSTDIINVLLEQTGDNCFLSISDNKSVGIINKKLNVGNNFIDISKFADGIYYFTITYPNHYQVTKKVLKQ